MAMTGNQKQLIRGNNCKPSQIIASSVKPKELPWHGKETETINASQLGYLSGRKEVRAARNREGARQTRRYPEGCAGIQSRGVALVRGAAAMTLSSGEIFTARLRRYWPHHVAPSADKVRGLQQPVRPDGGARRLRSRSGCEVVPGGFGRVGADDGERGHMSTEAHPALVEMVNAVKMTYGDAAYGPFYINEHHQVIVPVGEGPVYYLAGKYEEPLRFEFEGEQT